MNQDAMVEQRGGEITEWERFLGGRVLGWLGGVAVLLGIVFFLGMAVSHAWIDEPTRILLALLGCTGLLGVGIWLHERKERTEAALAAVSSAVAGLFATLVVGTQVYDVIAAGPGLIGSALVGLVAVSIAVRWRSRIVGAIGILGSLLAPVLVGADASLGFTAIALTAAVAVVVWQRWNWLSLGAFAVSIPQLIWWGADRYDSQTGLVLAALAGFWMLFTVAAIGYEIRSRAKEAMPVASWLLLLANAATTAGLGYLVLTEVSDPTGAVAWLLGVAAIHIVAGAFALSQPVSREVGSLPIAIGIGLSALGLADALDGPALVASWAVLAATLGYLATRASAEPVKYGSDAGRLMLGAAMFLGFACGHTLLFEAPPSILFTGVQTASDGAVSSSQLAIAGNLARALEAIGASTAAALACGALWRRAGWDWSEIAEVVGATGLVYLGSVAIVGTVGITDSGEIRQGGQAWLSAFWAATGLGTMLVGLLCNVRRLRIGGLLLLGVAIVKVYTYDLAELDELARALSFIALGLFLLVGAFAYQRFLAIGAKRDRIDAR
jgi:uncharacterized membrane protein